MDLALTSISSPSDRDETVDEANTKIHEKHPSVNVRLVAVDTNVQIRKKEHTDEETFGVTCAHVRSGFRRGSLWSK